LPHAVSCGSEEPACCARAYGQEAGWSRGGLSKRRSRRARNLLRCPCCAFRTVTCLCRVAVKRPHAAAEAHGQRQVGQEEGCRKRRSRRAQNLLRRPGCAFSTVTCCVCVAAKSAACRAEGIWPEAGWSRGGLSKAQESKGPKSPSPSWLCLQTVHMLCRVAVKGAWLREGIWPEARLVKRRAVQSVGVEGAQISFAVPVVPSAPSHAVSCGSEAPACRAEGIWPEAGWSRGGLSKRRSRRAQNLLRVSWLCLHTSHAVSCGGEEAPHACAEGIWPGRVGQEEGLFQAQ